MWLWALVVAAVVAQLRLVAGAQLNVLADLNGFPPIPVNEGALTAAGIVTAVVLVLAGLVGAVTGMRFHRRVDRSRLPATEWQVQSGSAMEQGPGRTDVAAPRSPSGDAALITPSRWASRLCPRRSPARQPTTD